MMLVPQALQLFLNGIEREVRRQKKGRQWQLLHTIASRLPFGLRRFLFRAVHQRFGARFRLFVSGGAYLPPELARRWENMGFRVLQANKRLASHQQMRSFTVWPEPDFPRTHTLKVKRQEVMNALPKLREMSEE